MFFKLKAYYLLIGFFIFTIHAVFGQEQKIADSLAKIYKENKLADTDTAKLRLLRNLSFNEVNDLKLALQYAEELIILSKKLGNNYYLHIGYFQKGNIKRLLGDLEEALEV